MFTQIIMVNITLAIPDSLHAKLKSRSEIRWSEVMRQMLQRKIEQLDEVDKILEKSKFTQKDVEIIGRKVKRGIAKRHGLK